MYDLLEPPQRRRVGEDDRAERAPVDRAAGLGQDARAEGRHDLLVDRLAGPLQLVRHPVGVDRVRAQLAQQPDHGALAAGDVAGQADQVDTRIAHSFEL